MPNIRVLVERAARCTGLDEDRSREGANGITALAEIIANDFFGLGLGTGVIDVPSWSDLCDAVQRPLTVSVPGDPTHAAKMGYISPFLERQQVAGEFIAAVLEYYDGWIRPNGATLEAGQFPHDGVTPVGLAELSYHDFIEHPEFDSPGLVGVFTDADVVHVDRDTGMQDTSTPGINTAARSRVGEYRPQTYQRPFIVTSYQGREMANELAKFYARPEETATCTIRREKVTGLRVGDRFILNDAPNAATMVVRITERVDPGSGGEVELSLVAERGLAPLTWVAPADASPVLPDPALVPVANARIFQLPAKFFGEDEADPAPAVVPLAQRPGAHVAGFNLHFSEADVTYDELARVDRWATRGTLVAGISAGAGTLTVLANDHDLAILQAQSDAARDDDTLLGFVDFELVSIGNVVALGGGQYQCTVLRGRRGSAAAAHLINAPVYIIPREDLAVFQHAKFPRTVANRYFKLQTFTDVDEDSLASSLKITFTFDDRSVVAPASITAVGKAEAIYISWPMPNPPDPTIAMVELFIRSTNTTPNVNDVPEWEGLAAGHNLGGLAGGTHRWFLVRFRDTLNNKSAFTGPADAIALAVPSGAPGATGNYIDYIFKRAATQPATPTGNNPAGWSDGPPAGTDPLWMSSAEKTAAGVLVGVWSTPVRLDGSLTVQYSVDGATSWHANFTAGDLYMRTSTDGGNTWSAAIRIVGEAGAAGTRGSKSFYRALAGAAVWSDSEADAAITAFGLTKVTIDTVTLYKTSAGYSETKFWDGAAWQSVAQVIDGNLVVHGTIGTDHLIAGIGITSPSITGGTITGASLIINTGLGLRYVTDAGVYTITGGAGNGIQHGPQIDLQGTDFGSAGAGGAMVLQAGNGTNGYVEFRTNYGGTTSGADYGLVRMTIARNGDVTVNQNFSALSLNATSARRFKKNIRKMRGGLSTVEKLRGVTFKWKELAGGRDDFGLIAEEVLQVLPTAVARNEKGKVSGVDYGKLSAVLIEAVKELSAEVRRLKANAKRNQKRRR